MIERLAITVGQAGRVSALLDTGADPRSCFVFAHGAGAGMDHAVMTAVAEGLAQRGIATLRYQFPYMERGSRRPDPPALCQATVRAAVEAAARMLPVLPLIAGGKSFGGRMTSQAQSAEPLPGVIGLAFLGFPLHPAGKPSAIRGDHLHNVNVPMLFIQGERAKLDWIEAADHWFHVLKRSGRTDREALDEVVAALAVWTERLLEG